MKQSVDQRECAYQDVAIGFRFAHELFKPMTRDHYAWLRGTECQRLWSTLAKMFDDLPSSLPLPEDWALHESSYIATFDVGEPTPPVPLLESHYNHRDPVPKILHENILFYRRFGLELKSTANETADHIRHQLEFVAYLCDLAVQAEAQHHDTLSQIECGLSDYVSRHLLTWLPQACAAAKHALLAMAAPCLQLSLDLCKTVV